MNNKPRCSRPQRFLLAQNLAKKLIPLGACVEGSESWKLIVPFKSLEELKGKRRRITILLRRYEGLIEEHPDMLEGLKTLNS